MLLAIQFEFTMTSLEEKTSNSNKEVELYNEQLEKEILGLILIENKVFHNVELILTEESFYFEINKIFFKTIKNLLQNNGQADEENLYYNLINSSVLEYKEDELKKAINNLILAGAGAFSTPKEIVKILNFLTLKRKLFIYGKTIDDVINNTSLLEIDKGINDLEQQIYEIVNNNNPQESHFKLDKYTRVLYEKLQKARKSDKTILGIKTGLTDLDNYTGGLQKSDLIIIAARPSMGKTALAITIAKNAAEILKKESYKQKNDSKEDLKPQAIGVFSLEMSGEQLVARMVSMDSKFSTKTIHTGRKDEFDENNNIIESNKKITDTEWNKICQSMSDIGDLPLYIDDTPALNISILRSRARFMKSQHNVCAIIIDYLQLIRPSKNLGGNRVLEIAEITSTLKAIAKELDVPVIALSQLSRAVEGNDRKDKRPMLSDLRESGTIEQDADIVMLLYREEYYMSRKEPKVIDENDELQVKEHEKWLSKYNQIKNLAEIIVAKNRNGPVGTITLSFDKEHTLFTGYEPNRSLEVYGNNNNPSVDYRQMQLQNNKQQNEQSLSAIFDDTPNDNFNNSVLDTSDGNNFDTNLTNTQYSSPDPSSDEASIEDIEDIFK